MHAPSTSIQEQHPDLILIACRQDFYNIWNKNACVLYSVYEHPEFIGLLGEVESLEEYYEKKVKEGIVYLPNLPSMFTEEERARHAELRTQWNTHYLDLVEGWSRLAWYPMNDSRDTQDVYTWYMTMVGILNEVDWLIRGQATRSKEELEKMFQRWVINMETTEYQKEVMQIVNI